MYPLAKVLNGLSISCIMHKNKSNEHRHTERTHIRKVGSANTSYNNGQRADQDENMHLIN